jgi:uroporphyrinogen decarboxylase
LYDCGGVIAQCEFGPGANPQNIFTVFETWQDIDQRLGKQSK